MKHNSTIKTIGKYLSKWTYCLGLRWWNIDVYYVDKKQAKKLFKRDEANTAVAQTYADWRYLTASIYFNVSAMKHLTSADIENTVIHELCHILINEMREGELHHEERVVTGLTKAFLWTDEKIKEDKE